MRLNIVIYNDKELKYIVLIYKNEQLQLSLTSQRTIYLFQNNSVVYIAVYITVTVLMRFAWKHCITRQTSALKSIPPQTCLHDSIGKSFVLILKL